ncbi:MAG: response regulator [Gammaproteobacteria bacterium]|nr:MAG: response regulator [Gammaproteobacteria bacterium]
MPDVAASDGAPTVLVIEDDSNERKWLSRTLAEAGYGVVSVASGAEAISAARERRFDAMTLDLLLPDMNGWEVLEAVRGTPQNAHISTVVITVVKDGANGRGVQDLLVKPVSPEALLASLRRAGVPPEDGAILVVDDDAPTLHMAALALIELGYRPVCEQRAADALRFIENEQPAAIVVDLIMPEMTGFELIERLRAAPNARDLPIIVWTARDLGEEDVKRLRGSGETVIAKTPGDIGPLLRELRRVTRSGNHAAEVAAIAAGGES